MNKQNYLQKNIEKLVGKTRPELTIPKQMKANLLNNLVEEANRLSSGTSVKTFTSRFMARKIATFATAAGVIAAVFLGVVVLNKLAVPAYAIAQTIKALQKISTVHVIGTNWDGNRFETWNKMNPETGKSEWCCIDETPHGYKIASTPKGSCVWDKDGNIVRYSNHAIASNDFRYELIFEDLSNRMKNPSDDEKISIYREKDSVTGKDVIVIWVVTKMKDFKVYVDPATKLPIRTYYDRADNMVQIAKSIDQIFYNVELTEGMFDFEVPQEWHRDWSLRDDPSKGMVIGDLTHEQGAIKTAKEYWQAVIENNWDHADRLRPIVDWKTDYRKDRPVELIEIKQPYPQRGCSGLITPCIVRFANGKTQRIELVVDYRKINGQASTVIVATWGWPKLLDEK
ncbi:MAG: hypothetical protein ACYTE8_08585 [Planctomycetota bacterium]|jgi:hypothetical protein